MDISLSSFKKGFGLKELLSESIEEYWCTDELLPHLVKISFDKKTYVYSIRLILNLFLDASYTPLKFIVYFNNRTLKEEYSSSKKELEIIINSEVFDVYVTIVENHSDGKDSHVRRMIVMESPTEIMKI